MKHFIIKNGCKVVCISAIALSSLSSCMKDDLTNYPAPKVSLKFDYTYNAENADAFSQEVKNLNVYVFDKNGKYFDTYTQSADKFETGHSMDITDLQEGKYTFVCLARDKKPTGSRADGDDEMEFSFTQLTPFGCPPRLQGRQGKGCQRSRTEQANHLRALQRETGGELQR